MNRFVSIICCGTILSFGASLLGACVSDSSSQTLTVTNDWVTVETEPYRGKRDSISFVDAQTGWYGTGKGDLFRSEDGGDSWNLIKSKPGTFIRAVAFQDRLTGYIGNVGTDYYPGVTDETPLYKTLDGGKTWTPVDLQGQTIKGVCAIDLLKTERIYQGKLRTSTVIHAAGRVGGPVGILRSVDDGKSWTVIDMNDHAGMILDVKFFSEREGLVFAATSSDVSIANGLILKTQDGGQSWQQVYQSDRPMELVWKASFPNNSHGYATVQSYNPDRATQLIVKTTDGGETWTEMEMTQNAKARQFGIGFVDENYGWVGTMAGGFFTSDGGDSFQEVPIAKAANKFQILRPKDESPIIWTIGTEVQRLDLRQ